MGAALAYYIALSLAPTVVILLATAGLAFGGRTAEGHIIAQIQGLVGARRHEFEHCPQHLQSGQRSDSVFALVLASGAQRTSAPERSGHGRRCFFSAPDSPELTPAA